MAADQSPRRQPLRQQSQSLPRFLWPYIRRYLAWGLLSAASLVLFGAMSAGMFAALPPLLADVLPGSTGQDVLEVFGVKDAADAALDEPEEQLQSGALRRARDWIESHSENAKEVIANAYIDVRDGLGVREGNRLLRPEYFAPLLFVVVFLCRSLFSFLSAYSFNVMGYSVTTELRNDLYERILNQSVRFHSEHPSGELYSRVVNDVSRLQNAVANRLQDLFQQSLSLVIVLANLFIIDTALAFVCVVAMPAFIYPIARFGKSMRKTSHRSQERMADLSELLTEGVRGSRVVKAFGMESFESTRFRRATRRHLRVNLKAQLLSCGSGPVMESIAAIGGAALLAWAGGLMRSGQITPPLLMSFLFGLAFLYDPVRKLNKANLVLQEATAAAQRVRDLMALPNEIVDRPDAEPLERFERGIRFEDVSFNYGNKAVLEHFDLEVRAGEVVALVGPSGAGKSTIVNLLPRFFDPDHGRVTLDGVDIRSLPLHNLRSLIGVVTQDTILFNDTVRHNIAYGRSDLSLERVREAAAAAYADEFIAELEHGYDTLLGESGLRLSGGQRQRIAIARALLKNAPILVLDEATSHLDTESELLVQRAIYNLMEGRTALVIAHRLSTIVRADRILVLEHGKVVEEGTHDQLLAFGGAYKRLYDLQFP